jgi:hypothetical protein
MLEPSAIIAFFRMTDQTYDFILRSNFLGGFIILSPYVTLAITLIIRSCKFSFKKNGSADVCLYIIN